MKCHCKPNGLQAYVTVIQQIHSNNCIENGQFHTVLTDTNAMQTSTSYQQHVLPVIPRPSWGTRD